jgi:histone acetyltransferase MYST1
VSLNEKLDTQPFAIGHCLVVKYRDNSQRLAKIIECMKKDDGSGYNYYVHYFDFNRRMDEWIEMRRIISFPSIANPMEAQYTHHHHPQHNKSHDTAPVDTNEVQKEKNPENADGSGPLLTTISELEHDEHEGLDEAQLKEHEQITKVKNIQTVQLGKYAMECWYFSPFPKEFYAKGFAEYLYFCEYSLRFFATKEELLRFQRKGIADKTLPLHPPGHEIYRDETLSMFELDGSIERIYCQNLCYFAKLFLDHKTLFWDVDAFLFYVLCTRDERGFHPVGYFSKEKYSDLGYNLACILTFPCVQRRGYGRFLIEFSYELSKKEDKYGSPEKPLSDLGALGYKSYWSAVLVRLLRDKIAQMGGIDYISIADLACLTSFQPEDIIATLQYLGLLVPLKQYEAKLQPISTTILSNNSENGATTMTQSENSNEEGMGELNTDNNPSDDQAPTMDVDEEEENSLPIESKSEPVVFVEAPVSVVPAVPAAPKSRQPPQLRRHHQQKQTQAALRALNNANAAGSNAAAVIVTAPDTQVHNNSKGNNNGSATNANAANSSIGAAAPAEENYVLLCDLAVLDELAKMFPEGQCRVQPHRLHWTPFYIMDAKKDKWNLYHLRQATQSNPQTCHVLPFLQQEQQQQQQQSQNIQSIASQGNFIFSGITRNISSTLFGDNLASNGIGVPSLSRQTTLLLNSNSFNTGSGVNNGYNMFSRLSTPNLLSFGTTISGKNPDSMGNGESESIVARQ